MNERRFSYRRSYTSILNGFQEGTPVLCAAEDISATGMRLRRMMDPRAFSASEIRLEFQLPDDEHIIYASAKPVRLTGSREGMCVEFKTISPVDQKRISDYVYGQTDCDTCF